VNPRLTIATSFPIFPPRGGGQRRVSGLYGALAKQGVEVEIVSLVSHGSRAGPRTIAPGVREIRVPKTSEHETREAELHRSLRVPVSDIALALYHDLTPDFAAALATSARDARAIVLCHPFAYRSLPGSSPPLVYEAQDVELDLKLAMLDETEQGRRVCDVVREVEAACCRDAQQVLVCSEEDGDRLQELYAPGAGRVVIVPNGADSQAIEFIDAGRRDEHRRRLGLTASFHAVFVGSYHEPNLVAVRDILAAAPLASAVRFLVIGSAGQCVADDPVPDNVDLCGVVPDEFIRSVLGFADAALNPMRLGSGTNLKMLDYAFAGVPVLSSAFGARGLGLEPGSHFLLAEPADLPAGLEMLRREDPQITATRALAANELVRSRYSWSTIAARWLEHPAMRELLDAVPVLS